MGHRFSSGLVVGCIPASRFSAPEFSGLPLAQLQPLRQDSHLCNLNELDDGVFVGDRLGFGLGHDVGGTKNGLLGGLNAVEP